MNLTAAISIYSGGPGSGCNPEVAEPRCGRPSGDGHGGKFYNQPTSVTKPITGIGFRRGTAAGRVFELLRDGQRHTINELREHLRTTTPAGMAPPRLDWTLSNMQRRARASGYELNRRGRGVYTGGVQLQRSVRPATAPTPSRTAQTKAEIPSDFMQGRGVSENTQRVGGILRDGQWHTSEELAATLQGYPASSLPARIPHIDEAAALHGYHVEHDAAGDRYRLTSSRGTESGVAKPPAATTPAPTQQVFPVGNYPGDSRHVQGMLGDGQWHSVNDLHEALRAGPLPDVSDERLREQLDNLATRARDAGFRLEERNAQPDEAPGHQVRLVRGTGPTITPTPSPTPAPKPTSPSSALGAFGFNPNGRAEAGARVLLDGQWHERREFDQAVMDPARTSHGISSADQALNVVRERAQQRNLGRVETEGTRVRLGPPPPPPPPPPERTGQTMEMPTPTRVGTQRLAVGSLHTDNHPTDEQLRAAGINFGSSNPGQFEQEMGFSAIDYKNKCLSTMPDALKQNTTMLVSRSRGDKTWTISFSNDKWDQTRVYYLDEHKAYHSSFFIHDTRWQGKDVGKDLIGQQADIYDHLGINRLDVSADGSTGQYAWARYGFTQGSAWRSYRDSIKNAAERSTDLTPDIKEQVKMITSIDDPKALWLLAGLRNNQGKAAMFKIMNSGPGWHGQINLDKPDEYAQWINYLHSKGEGKKVVKSASANGVRLHKKGTIKVDGHVLEDEVQSKGPDGKYTNNAFHESMLESAEGRKASDQACVDFATKNGWSRMEAKKWFTGQLI